MLALSLSAAIVAQDAPRARDLGVPLEGTPGPGNAITDVAGLEVGQTTLVSGEGKQAVRTGVTAILPRGKKTDDDAVFAGWFSQNGNGEMTGTTWVEESGFLEGPLLLTNTHSVGVVRDAAIAWRVQHGKADASGYWWSLPVVAETWDGYLNDINGFHVKPEHVFSALSSASGGRVAEGGVGGGTGMICYEFKGGIGTSSRRLAAKDGGYTVGVLVQCNCGRRSQLTVAGVPVGREIPGKVYGEDTGSIIIAVATDAPLLPHQLKRLARRATMGLARTGSVSGNGSGDIFIAFSTANAGVWPLSKGTASVSMVPNDGMDRLFEATVQATEEAIVNALVAARTMTGLGGHRAEGLPHDALRAALEKYKRLAP
jgi:L-aminopeptidase/D-esterase-like protein